MFVRGPYLVRNATIVGDTLNLSGDLNSTSEVEIIAPRAIDQVKWNGNLIQISRTSYGSLTSTLTFTQPAISLPDLTKLTWVRSCGLGTLGRYLTNTYLEIP